jgi:hypothetical protein
MAQEFVEFKQSTTGQMGEELAHLKKLRDDLGNVISRLEKMTWLDSSPLSVVHNVLKEEVYHRSKEYNALIKKD